MNIAMKRHTSRASASATAALAACVLAACGESDLEELHDRQLDDARAAAFEEPPAGGAAPSFDCERMELVFEDDFDGLALDASRWNTALPWGPDVVINDERQYYVDALGDPEFGYSPVEVGDGTLTIRASETPAALSAKAGGQEWLSGVLTTAGIFDFTHGCVEARLRLPEGRGLWPAVWMLPRDYEGLRPQLFVMERDGAKPESVFHNYEYFGEDDALRSTGQFEVSEAALGDGEFHTIGLSWTAEELLFYVDGKARYRVVGERVPAQPMYLVLNLAIGGTWPGDPDGSTPRPAEWEIDYVRVWQDR